MTTRLWDGTLTIACTDGAHEACSAGWSIDVERVRGVVLDFDEWAPFPFSARPCAACACVCHFHGPGELDQGEGVPLDMSLLDLADVASFVAHDGRTAHVAAITLDSGSVLVTMEEPS